MNYDFEVRGKKRDEIAIVGLLAMICIIVLASGLLPPIPHEGDLKPRPAARGTLGR